MKPSTAGNHRCRTQGREVAGTVAGADPPALTAKLAALSTAAVASSAAPRATAAAPSDAPTSSRSRIKQLLDSAPVLVFMKGTPDAPRCGFSSKVCILVNAE
jgi:hypothetical protein